MRANDLIDSIEKGNGFSATEIEIPADEVRFWVRIVGNPIRFVPAVFVGNWADETKHPSSGKHRVISIVECEDVTRAVIREGKFLFAYPWI